MPTITHTFKVMTDENGAFDASQIVNPPGPFGFTVELKARLVAPPDSMINGTLECNPTNGNPQNASKNFSIKTGETEDLGKWKLAGGDNTVRVSGRTLPAQANTKVEIEITAQL